MEFSRRISKAGKRCLIRVCMDPQCTAGEPNRFSSIGRVCAHSGTKAMRRRRLLRSVCCRSPVSAYRQSIDFQLMVVHDRLLTTRDGKRRLSEAVIQGPTDVRSNRRPDRPPAWL
jgi:hypothetical protein